MRRAHLHGWVSHAGPKLMGHGIVVNNPLFEKLAIFHIPTFHEIDCKHLVPIRKFDEVVDVKV